MNLIDIFARNDSYLVKSGDFAQSKMRVRNDVWRVLLTKGDGPHIATINGFERTFSYFMRQTDLGWFAKRKEGAKYASLKIEVLANDIQIFSNQLELTNDISPVMLSWEPVEFDRSCELKLRITIVGEAIIFVQRAMTRDCVIQLAKGKGVEIGPGPRPQIIANEDIEVYYVEEKSQEEWGRTDPSGKYKSIDADWSNYIVGKASSIPAPDKSLDFIFSSHVFEHLANPLGHLSHWRKKLKDGGKCIAVVPDLASCKDLRARPSTLTELISELNADIWEPEDRHYDRFIKTRETTQSARVLLETKFSIHVHYYTYINMPFILQYAVDNLGYKSFDFRYERNHKDFHFVLYA